MGKSKLFLLNLIFVHLLLPVSVGADVTPFGTPLSGKEAASPASATPAAGDGAGRPQSSVVPAGGDYSSSTAENMADRLFNVNSDSVDLESGTVQWKGRTFNLGDSRMMRARFERYLAAPIPGDDTVKYEKLLAQIEDLLSPKKITRTNYAANMQKAWELLFDAGEFEMDGENCLTIATLVSNTQKTQSEFENIKTTREQQEKMRGHQRRSVIYRARMVEANKDQAAQKASVGKSPKPYRDPQEGQEDLNARREELARLDAEILKAETDMAAMGIKSKVEFQSQIVAFLLQRRFQHAIIASSFYRQIFKGSAQELKVGEKQVREMFPVSDFSPTVESVDMLAREAIKDVDTGMKTVSRLYDAGNRYAAFERLQESFFLGEYDPNVMFFDLEKKEVLLGVWRVLRDLQQMGDERDLESIEEAVKKVQIVAQDFPSTRIMSRVKNAKKASNLAVISAKQAMLLGDRAEAKVLLEQAAKTWPSNPAIEELAQQAVDRTDALAQRVPEFDQLHKAGKYRDIFNRKEEFAVALLQDEARAAQLKEVVAKIGKIEGYILNAKVLSGQGNSYMAWDVLQTAIQEEVDDPELSKICAGMAPLVANYAQALALAKKHEENGDRAVSLAEYLAAQDMNQGSEICRQGIQRLSGLMLEDFIVFQRP
ncbi:MAG: hypothetical protein LBV12_12915 [Puniceicoccales bacterium]|jgi:hypothetical protein|nr:hypothetical protein [Puniceicoccales bacterium]